MNAEQTGRRVEEVLERLAESGDQAACAAAEELVRVLMEFYGAGLARLTGLLDASGGDLRAALDDELVTGLLVLHDLHPHDVDTRIERALKAVTAHPAEVVAFDPDAGTLRLRLADGGGGCGCASTENAARESIEAALGCFAPEVASLELEKPEPRAPEPTLLQIGARPPELAREGTR
ncbi:hypothetical protein [Embleya sp. NBC_00896]|uniref:hypothetical protein n=1 Tax=Embleya sp. NBC_00896 TaxID=2975961 RepID=UPI002F917B5D|nr:hypothetical protein OG928_43885 [Embleya sp. NBC_00896]